MFPVAGREQLCHNRSPSPYYIIISPSATCRSPRRQKVSPALRTKHRQGQEKLLSAETPESTLLKYKPIKTFPYAFKPLGASLYQVKKDAIKFVLYIKTDTFILIKNALISFELFCSNKLIKGLKKAQKSCRFMEK